MVAASYEALIVDTLLLDQTCSEVKLKRAWEQRSVKVRGQGRPLARIWKLPIQDWWPPLPPKTLQCNQFSDVIRVVHLTPIPPSLLMHCTRQWSTDNCQLESWSDLLWSPGLWGMPSTLFTVRVLTWNQDMTSTRPQNLIVLSVYLSSTAIGQTEILHPS